MMTTGEQAKHSEIVREAKIVGKQMDLALPFERSGWLTRLLGGQQVTAQSITKSEDPAIFNRRWLERDAAKEAIDSPIRLIEDTVTVDPDRDTQASQLGQETRVVAVYHPEVRNSLRIPDALGLPQAEAEARVHEIGVYVTDIANAQQEQELRGAVPTTPFPATA